MKNTSTFFIALGLLSIFLLAQPVNSAEANTIKSKIEQLSIITPQTTPVEITRKRDYDRTISGNKPQRSTFIGYHRYKNNGEELTLNRYSLVFEAPEESPETKPWNVFDMMRMVLDNHLNIDVDTSDEEKWEEDDGKYYIEVTDLDYMVDNGKHVTTFYLVAPDPDIEATQTWHVYMPTGGNEFEDSSENLYSFGEDQHMNVTVNPMDH